MRSIQGLMLAPVLCLGAVLGVHARGGVERVSKGDSPTRREVSTDVNRDQRPAVAAGTPVAVQVEAGAICHQDSDCPEDWICLGGDPLQAGSCRQTCQDAATCDDDGLECTDPACVQTLRDTGEAVSLCEPVYSEARCGHLRSTHLVTMRIPTFRNNARSLGVWGECFDENLGPTVPSEECVLTVEAVQYRRRDLTGATKFDAVCVDLDTNDSVPTCSPMERDSIAIEVGPSFGVHVGGEGGIAAGLGAAGNVEVDGSFGFAVPIVVHRKFRYPMFRRFTGRVGGNILIDSGIGSIVAAESVIFTHDGFDGTATFFVTKPQGMRLTLGFKALTGDPLCDPGPCPANFANALFATGGLLGPAIAGSADTAGLGEFESDFDIQELVEALNDERQTINDISDELKSRVEEKITDVFETLRNYLGPPGSSATAGQRSALVDEMMNLLRERIQENLTEIREIVRDLVGCPDN